MPSTQRITTRDAKEIAKLLTMVPFWNPAIPK
jgi:hypothetical protein